MGNAVCLNSQSSLEKSWSKGIPWPEGWKTTGMVHNAAESLRRCTQSSICVWWAEERFLPGTTPEGSLCVPCTNLPVLEDIIPRERPHCSSKNQDQQREGQTRRSVLQVEQAPGPTAPPDVVFLKPRFFSTLNPTVVGGWREAGRCPFPVGVLTSLSPLYSN